MIMQLARLLGQKMPLRAKSGARFEMEGKFMQIRLAG